MPKRCHEPRRGRPYFVAVISDEPRLAPFHDGLLIPPSRSLTARGSGDLILVCGEAFTGAMMMHTLAPRRRLAHYDDDSTMPTILRN